MGQIVFNGQKPKYCNLAAIQIGGNHYNDNVTLNEIWLVDTTNSSKNSSGTGKYDAYIVGDGNSNAGQLAATDLRYINTPVDMSEYSSTEEMMAAISGEINKLSIPTNLSQLEDDENHRTVTDENIRNWNNAAAGEGGTLIESSEDITVVNDIEQNINRLEFANKEYDQSEYSGLGRVYLRKNIQTVHPKESETLFNAFNATGIYNTAYNNGYNAKYKELIEAGTYDADGKTAANTAYTTAYNNAITAGKTTEEAINLGNAAYVRAYKNAIEDNTEAKAAVTSVNTASIEAGKTTGNTAWATEYPNITSWNRQYYIDGRFTEINGDKYINITPQYRFSLTSCRIEVLAGEIYKIYGKKTDSAGYINWLPRFWMITETPTADTSQVKVLQAYKINNENFSSGQNYETVFINVEQDSTLWINYNTYQGAAGQCIVERIAESQNSVEANSVTGIDNSNTEYIVQYDYDLAGGILELPKNTILNFSGGSIRNGIIRGNGSLIVANRSSEIIPNTSIVGTWKNLEFYPKWFGAACDGVTDDTNVLQTMLDLSSNIGSAAHLNWYKYTFRTTRQLYLKSNTTIKGGTIVAKFGNQMSWILKTYNYVADADKVYGDSAPGALVSWQEHDSGYAQRVTNLYIKDLTLRGEYNEHLTNGEPDGKYTPIFGGLCLMATDACTDNIHISGVGVGLGRGACLWTYDNRLNIHALFVGFAGYAINGHSIRDSYINAYAKTEESSSSAQITPYYPEYQKLTTMPKTGYIYNAGGIDMVEGNPKRPYFCNIQTDYAGSIEFDTPSDSTDYFIENNHDEDAEPSLVIDNSLVDVLSEVFLCANTESNVSVRHPWLEQVTKCLIYTSGSNVQVDAPYVSSRPDYDIIAKNSVVTLKQCISKGGNAGITCSGRTSGSIHKYELTSSRVNILDAKVSTYPTDDDRFYFLSNGSMAGLPVSVVNTTTLNAVSGSYYRFTNTVTNLTVVLPEMISISALRVVALYFTTGTSANITFTSADGKPIAYFDNYEIIDNNSYEISCMFNGQKWIIAGILVGNL